ncbi:2TM domain-containing protein [Flavobacterium sp. N2270]|uniref:2TM domain-containing protein n=1 Tax=Flavobacterium sp. N2270 TaxID=2986831 RepID=UPI0022259549|nr:2TM domain-containing protein [Flavobacterium sp. N2270]
MNTNNDFERYQKVKKQVQELKEFYRHLLIYVIIMAVIIFINLKYTPEVLWFFWTLFGWGIGLFFHAMKVFNFFPFFDKEWEEKKIKEFMEEEKLNKNKFK